MTSFTILTNASAGSNDEAAVAAVREVLSQAGQVVVVSSEGAKELSARLAEVADTLVVAGGDGSLHTAVVGLDRLGRLDQVVLGLIPLGTGNDFARSVGIPLEDPSAAARLVLDGVRRRIDVLRDGDGGLVVNAVHAGVGAEAARKATPLKKGLGRLGYQVGALAAGLISRGEPIQVMADGQTLADGSRRVLQVAVGNGAYVGGGTPLLPDADPSDSRADVMVSFSVGPAQRLGYALRLRRGQHPKRTDVVTVRASEVSIAGNQLWLNADGELVGPVQARSWHVEHAAFTILAPS
jgi:YegS/Rv2252/BmrU family lipid kinase